MSWLRRKLWNSKIRLWLICLSLGLIGMVPTRIAAFFPNSAKDPMERYIISSIYGNTTNGSSTMLVDVMWALYLAPGGLTGIFGSMLAVVMVNRLGRVRSMVISFLIAIPGFALQALCGLTTAWFLLLFGQFLVFSSMSFLYVVLPIFISEVAPPADRGTLGSIQFIGVASGTLLAAVLSLPDVLGASYIWPYAYLICFIVGSFGIPISFFVKETPVALVAAERMDEARESFTFYRGTPEDMGSQWNKVLVDAASKKKGQSLGVRAAFRELCTLKPLRLPVALTTAVSAAYMVPLLLSFYSTPILQATGISHRSAAYVTLGMKILSLLSFIICTSIIDRYGRRPLVMFGVLGSMVCWLFMAICMYCCLHVSLSAREVLVVQMVFVICLYSAQICLNAGIRPIFWILVPEIFPFKYRVAAKMWGITIMGVFHFLLIFFYAILLMNAPVVAQLLVIIMLLFCSLFLVLKLPETKHKAPHEIFPQFLELIDKAKENGCLEHNEDENSPLSPRQPKR